MGWSKSPKSFTKEVKDSHRLLCQKLALDIDRRLVLKTPVDSGRARSNWIASINKPFSGEIDAHFPGENLGSEEVKNMSESIRRAEGFIRLAGHFPVIYLNNNLPYIEALDSGSSKQAPAGFVEASINEAVRAVK